MFVSVLSSSMCVCGGGLVVVYCNFYMYLITQVTLSLPQIFRSTKELFTPAYFRASVVLIVIWFTFSFG